MAGRDVDRQCNRHQRDEQQQGRQALQVNIRAGALPPVEADGRRYLRIPLNTI